MRSWVKGVQLVGFAVVTSSCAAVLGLGDFEDAETGSGGSGAAGAAGGTGGDTTGGDGGEGGTPSCMEGEMQACYSGPAGTEGVGICGGGTQTCGSDGTFGACDGETPPTDEDCSMPEDEDCDGFSCSEPLWAKQYHAVGQVFSLELAPAPNNEFYAASALYGTLDLGIATVEPEGDSDAYIARFDANGDAVDVFEINDAGAVELNGLESDAAGNVYITGRTQNAITIGGEVFGPGIYVAKLDSSFTPLWVTNCGGAAGLFSSDSGIDIDVDGQGDVVMSGTYTEAINCGDGNHDPFGSVRDMVIAKFDGDTGANAWTRVFGHEFDDPPARIAADSAGNVFMSSRVSGLINLGGGGQLLPQNGVFFLAKLLPNGEYSWDVQYGVDGLEARVYDVILSPDEGPVVYGAFDEPFAFAAGAGTLSPPGTMDGYVGRFDTTGAFVWGTQAGMLTEFGAFSKPSGVYSDRGLALVGSFEGSLEFGGLSSFSGGDLDSFVATLDDANGAVSWVRLVGGAGFEFGDDVIVATDGTLIMAGQFDGTINPGTGPLSSMDNNDLYLVRYAP